MQPPSTYSALRTHLQDQLLAYFQYDDLSFGVEACRANFAALAVVKDDCSPLIWREAYQTNLDTAAPLPHMVRQSHFEQYLYVFTGLRSRLRRGLCWGDSAILGEEQSGEAEAMQAHWAYRLFQVSALLTREELLADEAAQLDNLLAATLCGFGRNMNQSIQAALSDLQNAIHPYLNTPTASEIIIEDAPDCLPSLQAIYDELDTALLVLPDNSAETIAETDWQAVKAWLHPTYKRILLTTTTQLKLMASHQLAVAFAIGRFRHSWGNNIFASQPIDNTAILNSALATVFHINTVQLPNLLFNSEMALGETAHNLQNSLLKAQLQYELLCMIKEWPRSPTPQLSRERSTPDQTRLLQIIDAIDEWVAIYNNLLHHSTP